MDQEKTSFFGENREQGEAYNNETIRRLGLLGVSAYNIEQDENEKSEKERVERERVENRQKMEELRKQMEELQAEDVRLAQEQLHHEAELAKIALARKEKEKAMKRGVIGMTGWYNNHPEELDEIVRPEMEHDADYYRAEHDKTGKSFYNVVVESYRIGELEERKDEIAAYMNDEKNIDKIIEETDKVINLAEGNNAELDENGNERGLAKGSISEAELEEARAENYQAKRKKMMIEEYRKYFGDDDSAEAEEAMDEAEIAEEKEVIEEDQEEAINRMVSEIGEKLEAALDAELLEDEKAEAPKKNVVKRIFEKLKNRFNKEEAKEQEAAKNKAKIAQFAKRFAASAALLAVIMTTFTSCANAVKEKQPLREKEKVTSEARDNGASLTRAELGDNTADDAPDIDNIDMEEEAADVDNLHDKTEISFYTIDENGNRNEVDADYENAKKDKFSEGSGNLFDAEIRGDGEEQTATNKESRFAFGPIINAGELDGDTTAVESGYPVDTIERMSEQPEFLIYEGASIGAFDNLGDDYEWTLEVTDGGISTVKLSKAAEQVAGMSTEQRQVLLDAAADALAELSDGCESRAATVPAGTTYITAHLENVDGKYVFKTGTSSKTSDFLAMQIIDKDGNNKYNTGEIKLNILKAHDLVPSDMTLDQAEAQGYMSRYEVIGSRNKCGGQWVIVEKARGEKVATVQNSNERVTPENPSGNESTGEEMTSGNESTGNEPTGNESTGSEPTGKEPTGHELTGRETTGVEPTGDESTGSEPTGNESTGDESTGEETANDGKTDENYQGDDADPGAGVTPDWGAGDDVVQQGEETVPEENTDGVNENPEAQQDWAEQPTQPGQDIQEGGTRDDTNGGMTDDEKARIFEEQTAAQQAAQQAAQAAIEQEANQA